MPLFRDNIVSFADDHWFVPCSDDIVWVKNEAVNIKAEIRHYKKDGWAAAFLRYADVAGGTVEGLYLIPASDVAKVQGGDFDCNSYPNRQMIASWHDNAADDSRNDEVKTQKPRHFGLNDCAHFVTQSLRAGDIHVETPSVPTLFDRLRARRDTKTLAKTVKPELAQNTIDSGIMQAGDVIIYSKGTTDHHHSVVYMDNGQVAMHTWANHPDNPNTGGDWHLDGLGADERVTLIHFGSDDMPIPADSDMLGWWKVSWAGHDFFYHFDRTGHVLWTAKEPKNHKLSIAVPNGRGYWFQDMERVAICWTDSGTFEELRIGPAGINMHLDGMRNQNIPLDADKL
jgi:hypothetical protein